MAFRMDAQAIIAAAQAGGWSMLGDLAPESKRRPAIPEITDEERREAERQMSSLFDM